MRGPALAWSRPCRTGARFRCLRFTHALPHRISHHSLYLSTVNRTCDIVTGNLNEWLRNDVITLVQRWRLSLRKAAHLSSMEEVTMPQAKHNSKQSRRSKALPVLGAAG